MVSIACRCKVSAWLTRLIFSVLVLEVLEYEEGLNKADLMRLKSPLQCTAGTATHLGSHKRHVSFVPSADVRGYKEEIKTFLR